MAVKRGELVSLRSSQNHGITIITISQLLLLHYLTHNTSIPHAQIASSTKSIQLANHTKTAN
jgi:hypothetical protein